MGADFMVYVLQMSIGEEPDWEAGKKVIEEEIDYNVSVHSKETLMENLRDLKEWWNGKHRRDIVKVRLRYTDALMTGGVSSGDPPTRAFSKLYTLGTTGVLSEIGFIGSKFTPEESAANLIKGAKSILEEHEKLPELRKKLNSLEKAIELKEV